MSLAAPELVSFNVTQAPLTAVFALRNPAARASFTGAFYTLDCTDTASQSVTPGVLIVTTADRDAAIARLSSYNIEHVIELSEAWAPGQIVNGKISLSTTNNGSISQCAGMDLKGAW